MKKAIRIIVSILCAVLLAALIIYSVPMIIMFAGAKSHLQGDPKVMLILGYELDDNQMTDVLQSRLDAAIGYLEQHPDMQIIVSGGKGGADRPSEAECMRQYLAEKGVTEHIFVEDTAATTVENIKFSLELIERNGLDISDGLLIVTSEFHLARVRSLWKKAGSPAPLSTLAAQTEPSFRNIFVKAKEPFAILADGIAAKFD